MTFASSFLLAKMTKPALYFDSWVKLSIFSRLRLFVVDVAQSFQILKYSAKEGRSFDPAFSFSGN